MHVSKAVVQTLIHEETVVVVVDDDDDDGDDPCRRYEMNTFNTK